MSALERLRKRLKETAPDGITVTDRRQTWYRDEDSAAWADIRIKGPGVDTVVLHSHEAEALFLRAWKDHTQQICFLDDAAQVVRDHRPLPSEQLLHRAPAPRAHPDLDLRHVPLHDVRALIAALEAQLAPGIERHHRPYAHPGHGPSEPYVRWDLAEDLVVLRAGDPLTDLFRRHYVNGGAEVWCVDEATATVHVYQQGTRLTICPERLELVGMPGASIALREIFTE